ncbi:NRDE family protein [Puniceicoccaceae bacterium K14]|nr:NRDE family protein [Puniceicoccaceae bacterium K14]
MCTASWNVKQSGGSFLFSRDEQRSRPRALYPEEKLVEGVRVVSPIDPKGGGTWIIANEFGLVVSLLNYYQARNVGNVASPRTRGEIPIALARCQTLSEVRERIRKKELSCYLPFYLCCWCGQNGGIVFVWDGEILKEFDSRRNMITTSSFESEIVQGYREALFDQRANSKMEDLYTFHTDGSHSNSAYNPVMSRNDAFTQSLSVVEFETDQIVFKYCERIEDQLDFKEVVTRKLSLKTTIR